MNNKIKPGIPMGSVGGMGVDAGAPTADEIARSEARRQAALNDTRSIDERLAERYDNLDSARGGTTYDNEDWGRAADRSDPERRGRCAPFSEIGAAEPAEQGRVPPLLGVDDAQQRHPQRRLRLGYWFYKLEDAKKEGWHADEFVVNDTVSSYNGFIMWREMVAMEIAQDDYVMIMRELHHDQPMDQALLDLRDAGRGRRAHSGHGWPYDHGPRHGDAAAVHSTAEAVPVANRSSSSIPRQVLQVVAPRQRLVLGEWGICYTRLNRRGPRRIVDRYIIGQKHL